MMCPTYAAHCAPSLTSYVVEPIDCRISPTEVNKLATTKPIGWFAQNLIGIVPARYPGALRHVYPGSLRLMAFMNMNVEQHVNSFREFYDDLLRGTRRARMRNAASTRNTLLSVRGSFRHFQCGLVLVSCFPLCLCGEFHSPCEARQTRLSMMAFSGQAATQSPQAWQASAFEANACCQRCAYPLSFPRRLKPRRNSASTVPISNTL